MAESKVMQHSKLKMLALLISMLSVQAVVAADSPNDNDWEDDNWESEGWEDEPDSPWHWKGFAEAGYGSRLHHNAALPRDKTYSEFRTRLELDYQAESWQLQLKGDAVYDDVQHKGQWQTRTAAVAFSPAEQLDIKVGRQVLTWGTGDYLFLNDLFPKDWQSFFTGRDDEYLKAPSDSLKASWYGQGFNLDLVWSPEFTADRIVNGDRFSYFSPAQDKSTAAHTHPDKPDGDTLAVRLATSRNGVEYAAYGYHGYWPTPVGINKKGQMTYSSLNVWGASARTPLGKGVFNSELAWYDSREDRKGNNPGIANSQFRGLLGYEQEVIKDLTAAVQYYLEWTQDYDRLKKHSPNPAYEPEEYRQLLTLRLTWRTLQQKLQWNLFSFWSWTDRDAYLKPSVVYRMDDRWTFSVGANLFYGRHRYSFFGQHEDNSSIWGRVRVSF
ncbi:hypothetical protein ACWJJH_15390 [Endozoicomonadaceae bacterium StTr2]